ncbi:hypothetical protein AWB76_05087 [Caballeronia temeraria]|uniref:DUF72 domain-containing protein n=1 Tax=Caballeronia temeraria TaxID=1777137 RepID=A0A158C459_9BURK|nr:DUF72 domain-containing protein [Caballeronia temeraria]SAK77073.1 hypothetical protein AWB76_05087 [Caballeronia temeraria]
MVAAVYLREGALIQPSIHDEPAEQSDLFGAPAPAEAAKPATPAKPSKAPKPRGVLPAPAQPELEALAKRLPDAIHLGTSTWSFPGWRGIVYGDDYSSTKLSRDGLTAYGAHPLLKSVSIDRSFYAPLSLADYARHASQVPAHFRFIVKAPASVTDAFFRGERGTPGAENPAFLNAQIAIDDFVTPCIGGLGEKAGALVFQFSPLPDAMIVEPARFIDRLSAFLHALPPLAGDACYAVEIRDAVMLTPRFIRALRDANVRYCIGVHARMPDVRRQAKALALLDEEKTGPLVVRWSLHSGFRYEQAKAKYEPFDKIVDEDIDTREALAELAARYAIAGQPVVIAANNKAEGSAPLTCFELARGIAQECERARIG